MILHVCPFNQQEKLMKSSKQRPFIAIIFLILSLFFVTETMAKNTQFDRVVVFGASLSDSGNAFVLLSNPSDFGFTEDCDLGTPLNVPPYDSLDDLKIPDGSYARGGHHVTNGATWVEQLVRGKGLSGSVRPALRNNNIQASNFAVGGARANDYPCRFNLADQLEEYLNTFSVTSPDTLVIFEMGGNDVRDALIEQNPELISSALNNIAVSVQTLYQHGARNILLANVPAIGITPAVQQLNKQIPGLADFANYLTIVFNNGLLQLQQELNQSLPGIDVRTLDLFGLLNEIVAEPAFFGIINTTDTCVTPNLPPFVCKKQDTYLFWDGLHPTKAVHGIMAEEAEDVLVNMP